MYNDDRNKTNAHANDGSGGSVQNGLSEQKFLDQGYEPRMSGQGQRPSSPKKHKTKGDASEG